MKNDDTRNETPVKYFNWETNPFNFRVLPDLFVGYMGEVSNISDSLENGDKFSLLIGPTGSGKTTMLKFLATKFDGRRKLIYVSKPPKNPDDWVDIFTNFTGVSFMEKVRKKKPNLYNIEEWVNNKTDNKMIIMLIDESHEASIDTMEWLRTFTDHIDNLSVVLAGLPSLEPMLKDNLETFMRRLSTRVELTNLTKSETRELIKRRIEWAGGDDIKPFTQEAIEAIYDKSNGFPREIIRICNELVHNAFTKRISTIDSNFLNEISEVRVERVSINEINGLPSKQREILIMLQKEGELKPSEIVDRIDLEGYKNKENAIRSVNNILKRLLKEGLINRKGKGKSYQYSLSDKARTLMVSK